MRVLCVDDDRVNILLIEQVFLQFNEVTLACAESGAEALDMAMDWRPDLLVIDLHLPDTDGLALLSRLRDTLSSPRLPAVLCTAEHPQDVAAAAAAAGFQHTWCKPVTPEQVRTVVRDLTASQDPDR